MAKRNLLPKRGRHFKIMPQVARTPLKIWQILYYLHIYKHRAAVVEAKASKQACEHARAKEHGKQCQSEKSKLQTIFLLQLSHFLVFMCVLLCPRPIQVERINFGRCDCTSSMLVASNNEAELISQSTNIFTMVSEQKVSS